MTLSANKTETPARPVIATVPPAHAGETVTVGCKLPNGMHLDLYIPTGEKQRLGTGDDFPIYRVERVTVRGAYAGKPQGTPSLPVGAAGLTSGVPKDFWDKWVAANAKMPVVVNGLVFAHAEKASARAIVSERRSERTGLEGLDRDKPAPSLKEDKRGPNGLPTDED